MSIRTLLVIALLALLEQAHGAKGKPARARTHLKTHQQRQRGAGHAAHHALINQKRKLQDNAAAATATGVFTSITIPLQLCGKSQNSSNQDIVKQIMGPDQSLHAYFDQCSFGALKLDSNPIKNLVLPQPVPITNTDLCSGNKLTCDDDISSVTSEAEDYVQDVLHIDLSLYSVRIFVFPTGALGSCKPSGFDGEGCFTADPNLISPDVVCRSWVSGINPGALAKEVVRNLGLGDTDQGDYPSSSPGVSSYTCPDSYQSQLLGWTKPLSTLDFKAIPAGVWKNVRLPPRVASASNYLLLKGWGRPMFASYIVPLMFDKAATDLAYKLLINSPESAGDSSGSMRLAVLGSGQCMEAQTDGQYPQEVVCLAPRASLAGATAQVCTRQGPHHCPPGSGPNTGGSLGALRVQPPGKKGQLSPSPPPMR